MSGRDNGLAPKEAALFKSIVKHYETKQYKKGLKAADAILKKVPEHGETLAMKGLILNCQERKAEAYELVALGVKKDIKSHVCWHVYGLLYRSDREYLKAIKCYRGALRHDADNVQILRDLSLLQVQMRDLSGFVATRQHLLTLKPTNRNNWFTFAVSQHLNGQLDGAIGIVDAYEKTLEGAPENEYEHSEMLLYKNSILEEAGKLQEALDHLEKHADEICDKLFAQEKRAQLLLRLNRHDEAAPIYRTLLRRNPEHYAYHAGLQHCVLKAPPDQPAVEHWLDVETVPPETEAALRGLYAELQHQHPRSSVARRLPLDFTRDPAQFRIAAKTYMLPPLRKGVPSLFADIKPLYKSPEKAHILGEILEDWMNTLESEGKLRGESKKELPDVMLWVRSLVAQHYDMVGLTDKALLMVDKAIEHTPTLIDLYMAKARMYKHAGALHEASEWMNRARQMDLQDRYLNTKATRYMLRNDQVDEAKATIALFTEDSEKRSNLFDMQCMWYELEIAKSYRRQGDMGRALKNFTSVDKHFTDIVEDQFDFHTYCIRKMTLRAYVRMLRMEDGLHGHHFYTEAAAGIVETYIAIHDTPKSAAASEGEDKGGEGMSEAERKKAESKRRKAEAKAKAEEEAKKKAEAEAAAKAEKEKGNKAKGGKAPKEKAEDPDPDGAQLANVEDPLEKASAFLRTLQAAAPAALRTHLLACDLYSRKQRYLLVLRALRQAHSLAPADPEVHKATLRFLHAVAAAPDLNATVKAVIESNRAAIGAPAGESLAALNKAYLLRAQKQAKEASGAAAADAATVALLAAAEMQLLLDPGQAKGALALVTPVDPATLSLPVAVRTHQLLASKAMGGADAAKAFKAKALKAFPLATYFTSPATTAAA